MRIAPEACQTMTDVRQGVDDLDRELVHLFAERFRFMNAAARIKPERNMVRDEPRKAQVIANVEAEAARLGIDSALMGRLWEELVEASIAHELGKWDSIRTEA